MVDYGPCVHVGGRPSRYYATERGLPKGAAKRLAHHAAWEEASGSPVPEGLCVCHTCDTPNCIQNQGAGTYAVDGVEYPRYGHLWLGTHAANMADMNGKGRGSANPTVQAKARRTRVQRLADREYAGKRAAISAYLARMKANR